MRIVRSHRLGWVTLVALLIASGLLRAAPLATSPLGAVVAATQTAPAPDDPALGNQLALIGNGYDALLLRVHLIRQARRSVAIQTFIWTNDACGRLLIYELIEAARRGVQVRILADHMISEQDPALMAFLATIHPNVEVRHYRPTLSRMKPSLWRKALAAALSFRDLNQRMHNKVMLIDDAVLITGGRNVEDTYFDHSPGMNFLDRDVLAIGPVVRGAAESFDRYWSFRHAVPSRALRDVSDVLKSGAYPRYQHRGDYDFGPHFTELDHEADDPTLIAAKFVAALRPVHRVTFVADAPGKAHHGDTGMSHITHTLRTTLEQAQTSIVMQTPYLVLSPPARTLLRDLRHRHPDLRIRISSNSFASTDNLYAYSANYRLRNDYIEDLGLEVHEFRPYPATLLTVFPRQPLMADLAQRQAPPGRNAPPPFLCLHAKSLVVDGRIAFVGSYNLDPRSENLNTEVGLLIDDAPFARALQAEIERDLRPENSWVIARRAFPLQLDAVNALIDGVLSLGPVDVWPIQNTSSFELRPGAVDVPPGHPDFYRHHRDVGSFPGTDGTLSTKELTTRLFKAVGAPLTPIL